MATRESLGLRPGNTVMGWIPGAQIGLTTGGQAALVNKIAAYTGMTVNLGGAYVGRGLVDGSWDNQVKTPWSGWQKLLTVTAFLVPDQDPGVPNPLYPGTAGERQYLSGTYDRAVAGYYDSFYTRMGVKLAELEALGMFPILRLPAELAGDWNADGANRMENGFSYAKLILAHNRATRIIRQYWGGPIDFNNGEYAGDTSKYPGGVFGPVDNYQMVPYIDCQYLTTDQYDTGGYGGYPASDHAQMWTKTHLPILEKLALAGKLMGKRIGFSELQVMKRYSSVGVEDAQHGGGDDPYFITQTFDWLVQHDAAWCSFFNGQDYFSGGTDVKNDSRVFAYSGTNESGPISVSSNFPNTAAVFMNGTLTAQSRFIAPVPQGQTLVTATPGTGRRARVRPIYAPRPAPTTGLGYAALGTAPLGA